MISRLTIVILLGLVGYLGYRDFSLEQERSSLTQELARQKSLATEEKKSIEELNQKLQTQSVQLSAKADQLKRRDQAAVQRVRNLHNQLMRQRDKLESLHQTIEDRRQHAKDPGGDLSSQLQKSRDRLHDLEIKLRAAQIAEKGAGRDQNKAQIQDQIKRLKNQQRALQSGQKKADRGSRADHQALHKLEEHYAVEYAKYQSLETVLRARMQELAKSKISNP